MNEMTARCGYKCSLCAIYKDNLKGEEDRQRFRDALEKYYGEKLTVEQCYCDGCMTPDSENPVLITKDCTIRPCAISRGLASCAHCDDYPCEDVAGKNIDYERVKERYGGPLPEEDYEKYVMPYESRKVLDEIRRKGEGGGAG